MDNKKRCQSCGMPLAEGYYGTLIDGISSNDEYCKFCYQNGSFTRPDLTLEDMMQLSVDNMTHDLKIPEEKALKLALSIIPHLKRWQN